MRLPRIRLTTRRIMVLVAVVAIAMGMLIHRRNKTLSAHYLDLAERAASHRQEYRKEADETRLHERIPGYVHHVGERTEKWAAEARRYAELCDRLAEYMNQTEQVYLR